MSDGMRVGFGRWGWFPEVGEIEIEVGVDESACVSDIDISRVLTLNVER